MFREPMGCLDRSACALGEEHGVKLVSIGNGTGSRETDRLVRELIQRHPQLGLRSLVVSEAGASVYSASEFASKELPELDVSLRGAVSIARRLQDPLAELVKIEPEGDRRWTVSARRQSDASRARPGYRGGRLRQRRRGGSEYRLGAALGPGLGAQSHPGREYRAVSRNLRGLLNPQAFDGGSQVRRKGVPTERRISARARRRRALDASAVHPEAYPLVRNILSETGKPITALIGDSATLRRLDPARFTDDRFGLPTVKDILSELEKPGRDPRPEFKTAQLKEGVETSRT
jgi:protein Tex